VVSNTAEAMATRVDNLMPSAVGESDDLWRFAFEVGKLDKDGPVWEAMVPAGGAGRWLSFRINVVLSGGLWFVAGGSLCSKSNQHWLRAIYVGLAVTIIDILIYVKSCTVGNRTLYTLSYKADIGRAGQLLKDYMN